MSEIKKVFRFFTPDTYEDEERFLSGMALKGWHFIHFDTPMSYLFEKGQPKNCVYKLDFQKKSMDDSENYKALFEDLGWEHLQQFNVFGGQWHYFRKECEYGAQEELFTDNESKIDLLTGIRRTYTAIGLAALFINAINIANIVNLFQHGDKVFVLIILLILSVIIGLYAKVLTSITAKINKLKGKANPLS